MALHKGLKWVETSLQTGELTDPKLLQDGVQNMISDAGGVVDYVEVGNLKGYNIPPDCLPCTHFMLSVINPCFFGATLLLIAFSVLSIPVSNFNIDATLSAYRLAYYLSIRCKLFLKSQDKASVIIPDSGFHDTT